MTEYVEEPFTKIKFPVIHNDMNFLGCGKRVKFGVVVVSKIVAVTSVPGVGSPIPEQISVHQVRWHNPPPYLNNFMQHSLIDIIHLTKNENERFML